MDARNSTGALRRIAHEIIERQSAARLQSFLPAIPSRGVEIARRIAGSHPRRSKKIDLETGVIDVAMHRDDVGTRARVLPVVSASQLPLPLKDEPSSLSMTFFYTGRTVPRGDGRDQLAWPTGPNSIRGAD